jgi:hypothetical protein
MSAPFTRRGFLHGLVLALLALLGFRRANPAPRSPSAPPVPVPAGANFPVPAGPWTNRYDRHNRLFRMTDPGPSPAPPPTSTTTLPPSWNPRG